MYADFNYYMAEYGGSTLTAENAKTYLEAASVKIDILTFGRVGSIGFNNLTEFQKNIVKRVCCKMADFTFDNEDIINSYVSSYSINGVSVDLRNSINLEMVDGVLIPSELYRELSMTGLCCRRF